MIDEEMYKTPGASPPLIQRKAEDSLSNAASGQPPTQETFMMEIIYTH